MSIIISPTGGGIRNDAGGSGYWLASRGSDSHKGYDFELPKGSGQLIVSPFAGVIKRIAYPYSNDQNFSGIVLRSRDIWAKIFYFLPYDELVGKKVSQGQPIGIAQDISKKVGYARCEPHIHLQIEGINPGILL